MAQRLRLLVLGPVGRFRRRYRPECVSERTIKVVRAEVNNCLLPEPEWGSSSSVIRKTRFVAVLGALYGLMRMGEAS
jgi:hypothetical protein